MKMQGVPVHIRSSTLPQSPDFDLLLILDREN
jgi:hypothetical protein